VLKRVPECLASWDPNQAGDVYGHVNAPGREVVMLIKDGVYSTEIDFAVMGGMTVLFFVMVLFLVWRKKPI